jgi:hypothetical protein
MLNFILIYIKYLTSPVKLSGSSVQIEYYNR